MQRLIVTMPALYRPEILATTLWSFEKGLFQQFKYLTLIINVDPMGVEVELIPEKRAAILELVHQYFDEVITRFPHSASFPHAVHWLWSQALAGQQHFLHLEDDWVLNRAVPASTIFAMLEQHDIGSVRLHRQRSLNLALAQTLSLNPVFINHNFIAEAISTFQFDRDPEKQFQLEPMCSRLARWRHMVVPKADGVSADPGGWVSDTGVHWRKSQRLKKVAEDGRSRWQISRTGLMSVLKSKFLMRFKLKFYRIRLMLTMLWSR